ncbi:50S ribosomal protein L29 [Terriglobus tenax]|uniref:50S ribosomal protein L29 n=1 Tax=Terriglobus tenax TaxID=1111115 RepID=UPI0021DF718C|nr:50S ribosomal protein L29 [Terriglobus tenax]
MELNKIRNLSDAELKTEADKAAEQLFRLNFQRSLGNNEGVKKLKVLKQDIARMKTIARERQLGVRGAATVEVSAEPAKKTAKKATKKAAKKD